MYYTVAEVPLKEDSIHTYVCLVQVFMVYSSGAWTFYLFAHGFKGDKIEIMVLFNHLHILLKCAYFKGKIMCFKNTSFGAIWHFMQHIMHTYHATHHAHISCNTCVQLGAGVCVSCVHTLCTYDHTCTQVGA